MKCIPCIVIAVHLFYLLLTAAFSFSSADSSVSVTIERKMPFGTAESAVKISSADLHSLQLQNAHGSNTETVSAQEFARRVAGITDSPVIMTVKKDIGKSVIIDLLLIALFTVIQMLLAERRRTADSEPAAAPVFAVYEKGEIGRSPSEEAASDFSRLKEFLSAEYKNSAVSLEYVESSLAIPQHRVRILLKENLKMNFKEYITTLRMTEAKRLLLHDNYRVQDIAAAVGYAHATTFNHVFREQTGQTPREFRENLGGGTVLIPVMAKPLSA